MMGSQNNEEVGSLSNSIGDFSLGDLSLDEFVESVSRDCLSSVASHGVDEILELLIGVAVFELLVDVSHVVEVELSLSLGVQEVEVASSAFFVEGVSLNNK